MMYDFSKFAKDAKAEEPAHIITIECNDGDFVKPLARFLHAIATRAQGGHSFSLEADREEGNKEDYLRTGIDGDGADRILRVLLDGELVKVEGT